MNPLTPILSLLVLSSAAEAVELTFELPDNAKECFHEVIEEGTEATLEFQASHINTSWLRLYQYQ